MYRQLLNSTAIDELREEVVAIIWSWVDDMDLFFHGAVTAPAPHGGGSGMLLLDSVCGMLHFIKTQSAVDRIRWRLLLYFLALLVDERISHVGDEDEVVDLLVQYGWISEGLEELLKAHLRDWLKAGRNYVELAQALGGAGALICLPLWGPSAWEHHCHPGGEYWLAIIGRLRELGVPTAAHPQTTPVGAAATAAADASPGTDASYDDGRDDAIVAARRPAIRRPLHHALVSLRGSGRRLSRSTHPARGRSVSAAGGMNRQRGRILPRSLWPSPAVRFPVHVRTYVSMQAAFNIERACVQY